MKYATTFTIAVAFLCSTAAAAPLVTFESPCSCQDNHGKGRWSEKNDSSPPPADTSAIQAVTPSDIFSWQGPAEHLTRSSKRIAAENKWYALTGRVIDLRVEADGDLHIALSGCANDAKYWQARQAAIEALPPEQRAEARLELLKEQHDEYWARRQAIGNAIINASNDMSEGFRNGQTQIPEWHQTEMPIASLGSAGNPIYVNQGGFVPIPTSH